MTSIIIWGLILILIIGFVSIFRDYLKFNNNHEFAHEYRNRFVTFANKYFENKNNYRERDEFDGELYVWLTKNVSKIQNEVGQFGVMDYIAPFRAYHIPHYQIIINTIPKFRERDIQSFDVNSVDDCLLRYIGFVEEEKDKTSNKLKNPIIWFKIGIQELVSIPLLILVWFGIFSKRTAAFITNSTIYSFFTGIIALVTLISGIVTIIQGKEKTLEFLMKFFGN